MLVFVSDLHLVDSEHRSSLNVPPFIEELEACLDRCGANESCTLVLLGDIFELLKSDRWVGIDLRPWSPPSEALVSLVVEILSEVHKRNHRFFDEVNRLCSGRGLRLAYIPGNHDGLMFSTSMGQLRAKLRSYLPALATQDPTEQFVANITDVDHGTYAEHGHEFDAFNRVQGGGKRVIPGDVVVVEILSHLGVEVAKELGFADPLLGQYDDELRFLQDLDDVVPQDATALLAWVEQGLSHANPGRRAMLESAVCRALSSCLKRAVDAVSIDLASAMTFKAFASVLRGAIKKGRLRAVRAAGKFLPASPSEVPGVSRAAVRIASTVYPGAPSMDLIVAGHTHLPIHHPVMLPKTRVTYLNSGTWRRVLLYRPETAGEHAFADYLEATMVCVFRRDGGLPPRYDFRRRTYRG